MFQNLLKNLGLSEKEAKTYETALELGPATVQQISSKSGLLRTSSYTHVKSLIKKGLMSSFTRDKKTYFSVEPPENLERLISAHKKEFDTTISDLKKALPELNTIFATVDERPRVRFFEGKDGLLSLANDFMKSKFDSAEEFVNMDIAYAFIPPSSKDHRQRIRKKIRKQPIRILYTSKKGAFLKTREGNIERRFIPIEQFPYTGSITTYGGKVALVSHKKYLVGVIIENKEIASTIRTLFNLAWGSAKKG